MVTDKKIKGLEFKNIYEYFEYCADSIINGQRQQAKRLIKDLSKQQKLDAIAYFETSIQEGGLFIELRNMLIAS